MMNALEFKVSLSPAETSQFLKQKMASERVYDKVYNLDNELTSIILIYEQYYMRNKSRASLTVTINNFSGHTEVVCIPSGGSGGAFLNLDWGAGENFSNTVKRILENHIVK